MLSLIHLDPRHINWKPIVFNIDNFLLMEEFEITSVRFWNTFEILEFDYMIKLLIFLKVNLPVFLAALAIYFC